jgi:hypothetical protein
MIRSNQQRHASQEPRIRRRMRALRSVFRKKSGPLQTSKYVNSHRRRIVLKINCMRLPRRNFPRCRRIRTRARCPRRAHRAARLVRSPSPRRARAARLIRSSRCRRNQPADATTRHKAHHCRQQQRKVGQAITHTVILTPLGSGSSHLGMRLLTCAHSPALSWHLLCISTLYLSTFGSSCDSTH